MNKQVLILGAGISVFALFSLNAVPSAVKFTAFKESHLSKSTNGSPSARTGAPGEGNCTSCHSGQVQDGNGINTIVLMDSNNQPVTEYTPGASYTVLVTTASATRRGIQISQRVLSSNAQAGTATGVGGSTSVASQAGKQFVNHTSASSLTPAGWTFNWAAPATNVGDVRFYFAANITNNNGSDNGDVIRLSQHTFTCASTNSIDEKANAEKFTTYFNSDKNQLTVSFEGNSDHRYFVNVIDMTGKSVFYSTLEDVTNGKNSKKLNLNQTLLSGNYIVNFFDNDKSQSKKIFIH